MRILKKIGLFVAGLALIYIILGLFGPKQIHVERSLVMNADAKTVYNGISNLKEWKKWSYWDHIDTVTMKDSYEGPESGQGAIKKWESPNDSVGKGKLTITKAEENKFVETELAFEGMGTSMGGWKISDTAGAVNVTTYMDMNVGFLLRPVMLFMNMDKMLGPDFEKSLNGLKKYSENMNAGPKMDISEVDFPGMKVLTVRDTCKASEIKDYLTKMYGEIGAEMKNDKLEMTGPVLAIYHHYSPDMVDMEAAAQVSKLPAKTSGRVKAWEMKSGRAIKAVHFGSYDDMKNAYDAISDWAKKNNAQLGKDAWEVYMTDPGKEPDPAKWETDIYFYKEN